MSKSIAFAFILGGVAGALALWLRARRQQAPDPDSGAATPRAHEPSVSSDVLANVSHEIRTPLNGILGLTQLLLESAPNPQQREYLEMIKSSGVTLLRALNDILDYSRIQAGKLSLESEAFHARRWVRQCIKTLASQAHMKGLELAYWVRPEVPTLIASDPTRLRQVLVNLAINAIKYTHEGHVAVEVGFVDPRETGGEARLSISVSDTGVGIAPSLHRAVFDAFTQAESNRAGESGLGLGLAISSQIIERMKGSLKVESEPGRGSLFRFEVPVYPVEGTDEETSSEGALEGMSALVVDDSGVQRDVLGRLLRHWGVEVTLASDEASAIAAVDTGRAFSLVLIDSRMPQADSFALASRLQKRGATGGVLMTLSHEQVSAEALKAHGFVGQLTKPIAPVHLLRAIEIIRRGANVEKSSDIQSYTMDRLVLGGLRILVAEDNPVNRTVLVHTLERNGCEVALAENGREALRLAMDSETGFDALLLDVEMPELDGLSVCREIRQRETSTGGHLAIVATTAHTAQDDRARCLAAGMDAFLSKPYDESQLVAAIDTALRRGGTRRTRRDVFDREKALAHANGDSALLNELLGLFLSEHRETLGAMREAIAASRLAVAERLAHRLKGALLTLSAGAAAHRAEELEACLKTSGSDASRDALDRLESEIDELLPVLRASLAAADDASVSS